MNQIELAWAAGFFDGEGCTFVRIQRNCYKKLRLIASINQVHPEVLRAYRESRR